MPLTIFGFQDDHTVADFLTYDMSSWYWQSQETTLLSNATFSRQMHIVIVLEETGHVTMYLDNEVVGTTKRGPQTVNQGIPLLLSPW